MKNFAIVALLSISSMLVGQTSAPKPSKTPAPVAAPNAPAVTDAQKLAYFKANSEFQAAAAQAQQAQAIAQQKQAAVQETVHAIEETCGKDFQPAMDGKGDPVCVTRTTKVPK